MTNGSFTVQRSNFMAKFIIEFTDAEVDNVVQTFQRLAGAQTLEQIKATVATEFGQRIQTVKEGIDALEHKDKPKKHKSKTGGRWARNYDECIKCHQQDQPHASKGLCKRCYMARWSREKKAKVIIPLDVRSEGVDTRPKNRL